jgi:hypothetical protein
MLCAACKVAATRASGIERPNRRQAKFITVGMALWIMEEEEG